MLRTGLNPHGLSYHLGIEGAGTPRANPSAKGLEGLLAIATELGARALEVNDTWLEKLNPDVLDALRLRLEGLHLLPVISANIDHGNIETCIRLAVALNAKVIRLALTPVTAGDRAAWGNRWHELVSTARAHLLDWALRAAEHGLTIGIENHQDFTSHELIAFCHEAGPNVGIVLDTGNCFAVGEAPLDFARAVAPLVRHIHLKDYRVQFTDEGVRLARCAIGDGAVPLKEIIELLAAQHPHLTAIIEPGGLETRHVRLFTPGWWRGYAPREAESLAACLLAAQRNKLPPDADYRTPWERGADGEVAEYELATIRRSAENLKSLGLI